MRKTLVALLSAATCAALLSGCGSTQPANKLEGTATQAAASQAPESQLQVIQPWIKAAKDGMTAAFATVKNTTSTDVTVTGASTEYAKTVELHETKSDGAGGMKMSAKEGGFTIPAGQTLTLEPGGDHIMVMGITKPIKPGDTITMTLTTSAGEMPVTFTAKEFSGAQENYAPTHG